MTNRFLIAVCMAALMPAAAVAATFNISGNYLGGGLGPVAFDFDVSGDFSSNISFTAVDSTAVSVLTAGGSDLPLPELSFRYVKLVDELTILYDSTSTDDAFRFVFGNFSSGDSLTFLRGSDSDGVTDGCGGTLAQCQPGTADIVQARATVSAVPLPASLAFLAAGIAAISAFVRRRQNTQS